MHFNIYISCLFYFMGRLKGHSKIWWLCHQNKDYVQWSNIIHVCSFNYVNSTICCQRNTDEERETNKEIYTIPPANLPFLSMNICLKMRWEMWICCLIIQPVFACSQFELLITLECDSLNINDFCHMQWVWFFEYTWFLPYALSMILWIYLIFAICTERDSLNIHVFCHMHRAWFFKYTCFLSYALSMILWIFMFFVICTDFKTKTPM